MRESIGRSVAVIGSGVAGLTAAYVLSGYDRVTLYEADTRLIAEMSYGHPIYTSESVAAQRLLPTLDSDRVVFAGAYHGWGFHEDGAASGLQATRRLGAEWPAQSASTRALTC